MDVPALQLQGEVKKSGVTYLGWEQEYFLVNEGTSTYRPSQSHCTAPVDALNDGPPQAIKRPMVGETITSDHPTRGKLAANNT